MKTFRPSVVSSGAMLGRAREDRRGVAAITDRRSVEVGAGPREGRREGLQKRRCPRHDAHVLGKAAPTALELELLLVALRIAFDLDGVLADMGTALRREERRLFGTSEQPDQQAEVNEQETAETDDSEAATGQVAAEMTKHGLTAREQRRLWRSIADIENFWETLDEIEEGSVRSLARVAAERRWEVIFLTKRPTTTGFTSQHQSQRWLERHGFQLPSVFVVNGSRGKIADALGLAVVVDDSPTNCVDVLSDSDAKAILVWRSRSETVPSSARRLGIGVVFSMAECLNVLKEMDDDSQRPTTMDRVKWALGLATRK
jgi:hypothetical protein